PFMLPEIKPATEECEGQILTFFEDLELDPPLMAWERAFGSACPPEFAAQPWIANKRHEGITGFLVNHPLEVFINGEDLRGALLSGLTLATGQEGEEAARSLLENMGERAPITFGVAASADALRVFRQWNWRFIGALSRWRIDPPGPREKLPTTELKEHAEPTLDTGELEMVLSGEGGRFFRRTADRESYLAGHRGSGRTRWFSFAGEAGGTGWLRARRIPSNHRGGREWLVEDIRAPLAMDNDIATALVAMARETSHPVYTSFFRPSLDEAIKKVGRTATSLEPRWGIFSMIGREAPSGLAGELDSGGPWALSPADLDLDIV
ncbi:MAG: hypothetical protein JJU11_03585, partial [Candidatus Sumerlaeia bacterium]|nr:hypothetical protein [Candidatus Sumerlaeia bacterium]